MIEHIDMNFVVCCKTYNSRKIIGYIINSKHVWLIESEREMTNENPNYFYFGVYLYDSWINKQNNY